MTHNRTEKPADESKKVMIRKVLFPLISLFLVYRSLELFEQVYNTHSSELSWPIILIISFILNLFITGIFAFPGFAFETSRLLPNGYYQVRHPKLLGSVYKILGVKFFRAFLLFAFWGKEKNRKKYFDGTKAGLENFDIQTRQSEFGHLVALITILLVSALLLLRGHRHLFILTTAINFISNFYPVVLQRVHRIQIQRVTTIMRHRSK